VRTLRTKRETTPEGFHAEVLSDHIARNREASQQVSYPQSLPATRVARIRSDTGGGATEPDRHMICDRMTLIHSETTRPSIGP
jgi:hypothetical protein